MNNKKNMKKGLLLGMASVAKKTSKLSAGQACM